MVFLRLTVKIFPREQQTSSSSFSLRSILGDRGSDREDATRASNATSAGKPASFLLVLTEPQDVSLGALARMIRDKWVKLRPNAEPLQIKKLLDDDHEADDLDADMTVADVFVDNGLGQIDGRDQRRTVRVIQKPAPYAPPRFPSVSLDWDAAAEDSQRQTQNKKDAVQKFPAIPEEGSLSGSFSERGSAQIGHGHQEPQGSDRDNGQDTPMKSVEDEEEIPGSPQLDQLDDNPQVHEPDSQGQHEKAVEATPQHTTTTTAMDAQGHTRLESQELGSPTPATRARRRSTSSRGRPAQRTISRMADMRTPPVEPEPEPEPVDTAVTDDQDEVPTPPGRRTTRSRVQSRRNQNEDSGAEAKEKDQDGDVGMDSVGGVDGNETTRPGKRKNSKEELPPNKEPRLDSQTREPSQETDRSISPSASRKPSFSRTGRRTSFTDPSHSPPKSGLGLGITQSPSRKRPVMRDDSAGDLPPSQTSVLAASVLSSGVKDTAPEKDTTPSKLLTPFTEREGTKPLHSALRKHSPVAKPPDPRSVSFSGQKDIIPARPAPEPKTTPTPTPSNEQWLDKMQFPPTISSEHAKELVQQEKKKIERENQEMREDEAKLTSARDTGADPEYVRLLEELCATRAWIANAKVGGVKMEKNVKQERQKVVNLKKKLNRLEAKSSKSKSKSEAKSEAKPESKTKSKNKSDKGKGEGKGERRTEGKAESKAESKKSEKQKDASNTEKAKSKKSKTSKSPEDASEPNGPDKQNGPDKPKDKGNDSKDKGKQKKATRRSHTESAEPAKSAEPAEPAEPARNAAKPAEPAEPAKPESQSELTNGDVPAAELDSGSQNLTSDAQQERQEQTESQQESHEPDKQPSQPEPESKQAEQSKTTPKKPETQSEPEPQPQPKQAEQMQPPQPDSEPKQAEQLKTTPKKPDPEPGPQPQPKQTEQKKPETQETSDEQSDDLKLPAMPNVRSVEQSKPRSPAPSSASKPSPKPSPKPTSKPTSPQNQTENQSDSESSSSESSSDEETSKPSGISQSQPQPQTDSRFSSPWARANTPSQSQPQSQSQSQLHTQPFQAINRSSTRTSLSGLKNLMDQQKSEHDARVQQAKQASYQPRKDLFDPSSDSDDDDSDSDSDSDDESKSSADEGDIQSSGTVGKLRRAISWRR